MSDWRSMATRLFKRFASRFPTDSRVRRFASESWSKLLSATGEFVTVEINGRYWKLNNEFRRFGSEYEPDSFRLWLKLIREGDTVWDIGANIGLYTMAAAQKVGSGGNVLAWEPTPETFAFLQGHVKENTAPGCCRTLQEAISDSNGHITFNLQADATTNRLGGEAESLDSVSVAVHTIDYWLEQESRHPAVVKIDIEGAEVLAFQGMERLLSETRPFLLVAIHPQFMADYGLGAETITEVLRKHNYSAFDPDGQRSDPEAYNEYLLVPGERSGEVASLFGHNS